MSVTEDSIEVFPGVFATPTITSTLAMMRDQEAYSWESAFSYAQTPSAAPGSTCDVAPVLLDEVSQVVASSLTLGECAEQTCIAAVLLNDGRFALVEAGCDTTGWGCQAGGSAVVADDFDSLLRFGMTRGHRQALGFGVFDEGMVQDG